MELIKTVTVMRHGLRTPVMDTRNLSVQTGPRRRFMRSPFFVGRSSSRPGQLTESGFRLCRDMGRWMRSAAGDTVPKDLNFRSIRVLANDTSRTKDSADAFARGITGRLSAHVSTEGELFAPKLTFVDEALISRAERQAAEAFHVSHIAEIPDTLSSELSLLHRLSCIDEKADPGRTRLLLTEGSGPRITGLLSVAAAASDALISIHLLHPDFPVSLSDMELRQLASICDTQRSVLFGNEVIVRNCLAPFLDRLADEIDRADNRFTLLSGHDSTVKAVLTAIGAESYKLTDSSYGEIPAGSCLNFEICSFGQKERAVRIRFIYPTDSQLLGRTPLNIEHPPICRAIRLKGLCPLAGGYYNARDLIETIRYFPNQGKAVTS